MAPLPGRRAGVTILSVEFEDAVPDRLLIRVQTVDDVVDDKIGQSRAFSDPSEACAHVWAWLNAWSAAR